MKLLQWLRLEEDGKISLTNLLMYGAILALVIRPVDAATVAALAAVVANYGHRRYQRDQKPADVPLAPVIARVEQLEKKALAASLQRK